MKAKTQKFEAVKFMRAKHEELSRLHSVKSQRSIKRGWKKPGKSTLEICQAKKKRGISQPVRNGGISILVILYFLLENSDLKTGAMTATADSPTDDLRGNDKTQDNHKRY